MLETGDRVPDLELQLTQAGPGRLRDFAGRWLVLYFYPKDNTPGCTTEGIDFNTLLPQFRAAGAEILGVSRDSPRSHQGFRERHGLSFDLVSDPDQALCLAFGVIREKTMFGRKVMGIQRSTFLIDPQGVIRDAWRAVKVRDHPATVLAALTQHAGR